MLISIACVLPCVIAVSYFLDNQTRISLLQGIDQFLHITLQNTSDQIDKELLYVEKSAKVISANPGIRRSLDRGNSIGINSQLNQIVAAYPDLFYVLLLDKEKNVFAVNTLDSNRRKLFSEILLGETILDHPLLARQADKGVTRGKVGVDPFLQKMELVGGYAQWFVAPVVVRGEALGWVVLSFRFEDAMTHQLSSQVSRLKSYGYPVVYSQLVDENNNLIAGEGGVDAQYLKMEMEKPFANQMLLLNLAFDKHSVLEPVTEQRTLLLVTSFVLISVLVLGLSIASNKLVLFRIRRLQEGAKKFSDGFLDHKIVISGKDEISLLAREFNFMGDKIAKAREGLEVEVQSRTKEAKEALQYLQSLVDNAAEAIITYDEEGLILSFNNAAESIFGYKQADIIGRPINLLTVNEHSNPNDIFSKHYLSHKGSQLLNETTELTVFRKDGSTISTWISISEVIVDQKSVFTALIRDITEQKEVELQLAKQQQMLEQMSAQGRMGAWEVDVLDNAIHWSNMTKVIIDVPADYEPNLDAALNFYKEGEHRDRIREAVKKGQFDGTPWDEELILVTAKGKEVWVNATGQAEFQNGQCVRLFGSLQDIDARIKARQDLAKAKDEAELAAKAKSEFLASMSHEIRTPMNGVLGMLGLLQQSELTKQQTHYLSLAKSSAESLLTLINDILDFSKVEAGKLDLELLDFNLRTMLGEFSEAIAQKAQDKGIEVVLDVTQVQQSLVKGDPGRIRQILTNLVSNSIKFTQEGEIVVRVSLETESPQTLRLKCSVKDTGIGIPEDKVTTLFDSFTQVDASTTRKYGGTGLGLAICKQLCELMDGEISIESKLGEGSCFTFDIKLEPSDQSTFVIPDVDIKEVPILIVDDNHTNRVVLRKQLEYWGANVTEAPDAGMAFQIMNDKLNNHEEPEFSVAFLDYQMPEMDGAELGRKIRTRSCFDKTKLVMMTSLSNRGDAQFFADLGFDAYFPKPATTSDLFDALSVVIAGGETLEQAKPLVTHHYLKELSEGRGDNKELIFDAEKDEGSSQRAWPDGTRMLLVEDNYINQAVATGIIESMGLTCDVAGNGLEALDALRHAPEDSPYTIVLMDCQMPEMDGYDATRAIRQGDSEARNTNIPVVAMTANAMKGDREACLEAGMNDYLSKPVDAVELEQLLVKWLLNGGGND